MKKIGMISIPILVATNLTMLLPFFALPYALAQDSISGEEYMQQHDGGDRIEYLQEVEHSDSSFYVPPSNDASPQSSD
ncbi:MAG: hypothetical protein WAQ29_02860 [Nitrososphaeraceae archaeon]|jgi:hypothetical protein